MSPPTCGKGGVHLSDSVNAAVEAGGVELSKDSNAVSCPCCGARLTFNLRVKVGGLSIAVEPEEPEKRALESLLELARAGGVPEAFGRAVADVMQGSAPRLPEKYLVTWLRGASVARLERAALQVIKAELLASGTVAVQAKDGIAAIVVDGKVRCFVPRRLLDGGGPRKLERKPAAFPEGLREWIRENKIVVKGGQGVFFSEIWQAALAVETASWRL